MEYLYGREGFIYTDHDLRTYQNLLENEPYTPYLDTFNVTGLIDWYYHPTMINESFENNQEHPDWGPKEIIYNTGIPEFFKFEMYDTKTQKSDNVWAHNKLNARTLKPKHFAYYYRLFDRLDREYGKIFDMKTGRMYPEAKEKFWPDAIDNIGITEPDYVNPRLKPENWRTEEKVEGHEGHNVRLYSPRNRGVGNCPLCN